ncbi:DUF427 domain-containing protein [Oxalobacteraceae sp. CFBP 8755]|nr:DUF427 domain-containing protein [Oxalobacteraceae sp. CFBP 8761]MBD8631718.1 DUF427 domain-containing protein [Oxalobacteraceae sp. CFBP 8755]
MTPATQATASLCHKAHRCTRAVTPSSVHSNCPQKGTASFYNVEVNGKVNKDAAWPYATPP